MKCIHYMLCIYIARVTQFSITNLLVWVLWYQDRMTLETTDVVQWCTMSARVAPCTWNVWKKEKSLNAVHSDDMQNDVQGTDVFRLVLFCCIDLTDSSFKTFGNVFYECRIIEKYWIYPLHIRESDSWNDVTIWKVYIK